MFAYVRKIYQNKNKVDERGTSSVSKETSKDQFKHASHINGDLCGCGSRGNEPEEGEVTQKAEWSVRLASVWLREARESKKVTDLWSSP